MNKLVIINGVTGAIGTACLAQFSREDNVVMYGLSRKASNFSKFRSNGYLPEKTLICSIGNITSKNDCQAFLNAINFKAYSEVVYIHAAGIYPFELDKEGNIAISNDKDGDGIDDRVLELSYNAYFNMVEGLQMANIPIKTVIFGGIADIHRPEVHTSWWTVMEMTKKKMKEISLCNTSINNIALNISSVICPHEILTRPYVFMNTNADARYWLMPHEVADEVVRLALNNTIQGYLEVDLYHKAKYYDLNYYQNKPFTQRKIAELGIGNEQK